MNDTPSSPPKTPGKRRFLPSRGCLFTLLWLLLLVALFLAFVAYVVWVHDKWADGIPRGTRDAWLMPTMLSDFPAYEPTGDVIQQFKPDDGKPCESLVYYDTQVDRDTLVEHYKTYLSGIGCTYEIEEQSRGGRRFSTTCPTRLDMRIQISDGGVERYVSAFWKGG